MPAGIAYALDRPDVLAPELAIILGLGLFGLVFAMNSALHSYLILAYTDRERVALDVGFYYMANAGGRLLGTLLSGLAYQSQGIAGWPAGGSAACGPQLAAGRSDCRETASRLRRRRQRRYRRR
ncbi:hypothetical protein [Oceanibaculum nanhaiense]|uniref:hypothetical protein n=1 Tax=Oceanibaculum nanhaiense TaxID=1909734 RepID=UPI003D29A092